MEAPLEHLLTDLHTIGQIAIGDKVATMAGRLDVQKEGFLQSMMRMATGDNRGRGLQAIENTIATALAFSSLLQESTAFCTPDARHHVLRHSQLLRLHSALSAACTGLRHLSLTYHADRLMVSQLSELQERCQDSLATSREALHL